MASNPFSLHDGFSHIVCLELCHCGVQKVKMRLFAYLGLAGMVT
jgi:hypothetical protein